MEKYGKAEGKISAKKLTFMFIMMAGCAMFTIGMIALNSTLAAAATTVTSQKPDMTIVYVLFGIAAFALIYGFLNLISTKVVLYEKAIVIHGPFKKNVIECENISCILWAKPGAMANTRGARRTVISSDIILKRGKSVKINSGTYRKLNDKLADYQYRHSIPNADDGY